MYEHEIACLMAVSYVLFWVILTALLFFISAVVFMYAIHYTIKIGRSLIDE